MSTLTFNVHHHVDVHEISDNIDVSFDVHVQAGDIHVDEIDDVDVSVTLSH